MQGAIKRRRHDSACQYGSLTRSACCAIENWKASGRGLLSLMFYERFRHPTDLNSFSAEDFNGSDIVICAFVFSQFTAIKNMRVLDVKKLRVFHHATDQVDNFSITDITYIVLQTWGVNFNKLISFVFFGNFRQYNVDDNFHKCFWKLKKNENIIVTCEQLLL